METLFFGFATLQLRHSVTEDKPRRALHYIHDSQYLLYAIDGQQPDGPSPKAGGTELAEERQKLAHDYRSGEHWSDESLNTIRT